MNALELQSTQTLRSNRTASGSRVAQPTDRTGEVIAGKWRLERALGVGGAGSVYGAVHQNGKRVAIKVLHPELVRDEEVKSRFLFEPSVTNRIRHPGVVSIHDDGVTSDGAPFFVMDLLEGETLEDRVEKQGALSLSVAVGITLQVLEILTAVHGKGIVHLDIKPSNIFLSTDGRAFLLDFGVARVSEGPRWTQPGVAIGTPMFMPPEQANADWARVDERSDLWGLGAALRYALTAKYLRAGGSVEQVMVEARSKAVSPATAVGIAGPVAEFLDRALAFRPQHRFGSALAMRHALVAIWTRLAPKLHSRGAVNPLSVATPRLLPPAPTTTAVPVSSGGLRACGRGSRKGVLALALLLPSVVAVVGYGHSYAADPSSQVVAAAASSSGIVPRPTVPQPTAPVPSVPPVPTPAPSPSPSPVVREPGASASGSNSGALAASAVSSSPNAQSGARPAVSAAQRVFQMPRSHGRVPGSITVSASDRQHAVDPLQERGVADAHSPLAVAGDAPIRRLPGAGLDVASAASAPFAADDPLATRL
jgi:serine/threonine-protein kinase